MILKFEAWSEQDSQQIWMTRRFLFYHLIDYKSYEIHDRIWKLHKAITHSKQFQQSQWWLQIENETRSSSIESITSIEVK